MKEIWVKGEGPFEIKAKDLRVEIGDDGSTTHLEEGKVRLAGIARETVILSSSKDDGEPGTRPTKPAIIAPGSVLDFSDVVQAGDSIMIHLIQSGQDVRGS